MPFLRQLYKQKPQAWGPVSEVQASLFKNAESIGIDSKDIALAMPMWGPGNQIDYSGHNANSTLVNGAKYDKNALYTDGVNGYIEFPNTGVFSGPKFTVISHFLPLTLSTALAAVWHTRAEKDFILRRSADRNYWDFGYYDGATKAISIYDTSVSEKIIACVWNKNNNTRSMTLNNRNLVIGTTGTPNNVVNKNTLCIQVVPGLLNPSNMYFYQFFILNTDLTLNQIAKISDPSDNPYQLWQRVPPVFYSVPGGGIIIKNITDSCIVTDSISQISNFFSVSDAGAGADGFAGLTAGLSVGDAGSGVDTVKPIASLTVQDTGSAIDLIQQISAACSVADTGTGTDSIGQLLASLVVSDAGAGADVITVLKELLKTVTDSGAGTDSISRILASLSVADTGSSTDTISQIIAGVSVSDTGTCVDFIALLKDILKTISDTGSGSDSVSIQPVSVSVQDAGTALDIIGHIVVALSVSDAGTIAEIISTIKTKMVTVTDTGTGSDSAPTISVSLTVSDTAAALDLVGQVINALAVYDIGSGLDMITKTDFDILPSGKVMVTFTIKTPGASFAMRTPKATFNIE